MSELQAVLSMKRDGDQTLSREERIDKVEHMKSLFEDYNEAVSKLNYIQNIWWDQERIEENYGSRKFYGAHRRLSNAQKKVEKLHKDMFLLLTRTDGFNIPFEKGFSTEAEECYHEFMNKYDNQ